MANKEWQKTHELSDGTIDLWLEEEFNSGSRLVGGRTVHFGRSFGQFSGEGRSTLVCVNEHTITITNLYQGSRIFIVKATYLFQFSSENFTLF